MKTGSVLVLIFIASSWVLFAQGSDQENAVRETERELCTAYLKGDADAIAQGVMEDYTLTNSCERSIRFLSAQMHVRYANT